MPRKSSGINPSLLKQSADSIFSTWAADIGDGGFAITVDFIVSRPTAG